MAPQPPRPPKPEPPKPAPSLPAPPKPPVPAVPPPHLDDSPAGIRAWFEGRELPARLLPYKPGETIEVPTRFVQAQLQAMASMPVHTRMFKNAFHRLHELQHYLKRNPS